MASCPNVVVPVDKHAALRHNHKRQTQPPRVHNQLSSHKRRPSVCAGTSLSTLLGLCVCHVRATMRAAMRKIPVQAAD
ncbi:unnamed protein product [Protopolystoma xenopodis]|uniref:Uncharacterized protein n=1 Tax=Protopolystoma xenopodis TaxID=117903 RepID=A0A448XPF4_9PLAT|nr:unnamed protein product [Protopolystoma xenopodis]